MHQRRACRRLSVFITLLGLASPLSAQDTTLSHTLPPFELHGFVQIYYRSGDPLNKDGFRLRKADLKFSGLLSPQLKWRVAFDASKAITLNKTISELGDSAALSDAAVDQRTRILQDAALTYTVNPALNFDIGQQIVPLTLEGTISTSQVETIERTLFIIERSRAGGLGEVRDIGVSANGRTLDFLEYHIGVFNETGEGAGTTDLNDQKAIIGRIALHPSMFPRFQIGGSGAYEGGPTAQQRQRAGGEIQYRDDSFTLRAETMSARDGTLKRAGWYGLGAYRPTKQLQFVARYDSWDRDLSHDLSIFDAFERQIVAGGSYLLSGSPAKIAVNVARQTFPNVTTVRSGTIVLVAFQAVW